MSAANVSNKWIGLEAEKLFEKALGRDIHFVNDADAAGYAETRFGAARGVAGLVILTTLGTGIGTAIIYNGVLIPNVRTRPHRDRGQGCRKTRRLLRQGAWPTELEALDLTSSDLLHDLRSSVLARSVHRGRWRVQEPRGVPAVAEARHPNRARGASQQRGHSGAAALAAKA